MTTITGSSAPTGRLRALGLTTAGVAAAAAAGSVATNPRSLWYRTLDKPAFQPPAWAFPAAWSLLYTDIAVTSGLTLAELEETGRSGDQRRYAAALGANLVLNAAWSAVFFRSHRLGPATAVAAALALSSVDLVRRTAAVNRACGAALAPYAAWTAFATALTGAIAHRNPAHSR